MVFGCKDTNNKRINRKKGDKITENEQTGHLGIKRGMGVPIPLIPYYIILFISSL
jgi:hypothetical protein